jgi:hypothetical protein
MKRTHTYGILSSDDRFRDEFSASLYTYEGERSEGRGFRTKHTMHFTLWPGEALVWRWDGRGKYHGREDLANGWGERALQRVANGEVIYRPDLRAPHIAQAVAANNSCVIPEQDTQKPAIHLLPGAREGSVDFCLHSPYPFVGGSFTAQARGQGHVSVFLVLGDETHLVGEQNVRGNAQLTASLDSCFPRNETAWYDALLRIKLTESAGVDSFSLRFDVQMAPLSLPELELGDNQVLYVDDSKERKVRVTMAWEELSFTRPPLPPSAPEYPPDGDTVAGTRICFRWPVATDPDGDEIADYQFQLSEREDMAWPLSPNFHKLISNTIDKGKPQYTLPYEGLLAPDTTYYWRVRAKDANGVWGPWSRTWRFSCRAPSPPEDLSFQADERAGVIVLRWRPGRVGSTPVRYVVYGSDEKGFSVADEPYEIMWTNMSSPNRREMAPNVLGETSETQMLVVGPQLNSQAANRAFYRVVAVDEHGVRSGASDYIALPRPFIYTRPAESVSPGKEYHYQARSLQSLGDLRCRPIKQPDGSISYYNANFWDIEKPRWSKVTGPDWLRVDSQTGLLSGTAPPDFTTAEVVLGVEIEGRGKAEQRFTIRAATEQAGS